MIDLRSLHRADDGDLVHLLGHLSASARRSACRARWSRSGGTVRRSAGRASCRTFRTGWRRRSSTAGCSASASCSTSSASAGGAGQAAPVHHHAAGRRGQRALEQRAAGKCSCLGQCMASAPLCRVRQTVIAEHGCGQRVGLCACRRIDQWLKRNSLQVISAQMASCTRSRGLSSPPRDMRRTSRVPPALGRRLSDRQEQRRRALSGGSLRIDQRAQQARPAAGEQPVDAAVVQVQVLVQAALKSPTPLFGVPKNRIM